MKESETDYSDRVMNDTRLAVNQLDMGGWVRIYLGKGEPTKELPQFLSHTLSNWIRERPHLQLRMIVPIARDGSTVELHAWYDRISFGDMSPWAKVAPRSPL